jgi:hypothetical protein
MKAFENPIDLFSSATTLPPSLNNACVVAIDDESGWVSLVRLNNASDQELEADRFRPADVSPISFPAMQKAPRTLLIANDDRDTK